MEATGEEIIVGVAASATRSIPKGITVVGARFIAPLPIAPSRGAAIRVL